MSAVTWSRDTSAPICYTVVRGTLAGVEATITRLPSGTAVWWSSTGLSGDAESIAEAKSVVVQAILYQLERRVGK